MELSFNMAVYKDYNLIHFIKGNKIMKKLYTLIFCSVILGGCNSLIRENYKSNIYGKWVLVNISGVIDGNIKEFNTKQ